MWLKKFIFVAFILNVSGSIRKAEDVSIPLFTRELEVWTELRYESESFKEMIEILKIPTELQNSDWKTFTAGKDAAICTICQGIVGNFINMRRRGMSQADIQRKIVKLCTLLNIQTENVCKGVAELNLPIIIYIIDSKPNLTASTICGVVLESKSCPLKNPEFEWSIDVSESSNVATLEHNVTGHVNILQLTDFHYDPMYEPNGNSKCGEPLCCRKGQNTTNVTTLAGFWGDYNDCDTPWHSIVDALTHVKSTHKNIDYIYFTGDVIDHGVWETSKEGNIKSTRDVYNKIHETFENVPVYPILGNHEPNPMNQFAPKNITRSDLTTNWLYEFVADLWIGYGWLPESTRSTIHEGGYYTVAPKKGFRIIALNSNVCYSYNWWLWYTPKDPNGQLKWLEQTLSDAEKNGEFVHILSHIPPNSNSCLKTWKREYLKIIARYSDLVKAEFNGHSHNDEISVFYNSSGAAKNVAWNGGSITTYSKLNPNYKLYSVNRRNYEVSDYQNWMYDLGSANKNSNKKPNWYKSYSFKTEYGLSDLSSASLSNWLHTAANNDTLLNRYYRNFFKLAKPSLQGNCDLNCKRQYLCRGIAYGEDTKELCNNILKG